MKYLFDTNLFLDILLAREFASIVERLIIKIGTDKIGISDFSLFSIGIYLDRKKKSSFFVSTPKKGGYIYN
jgi:predicted nucleic acid-binding protein